MFTQAAPVGAKVRDLQTRELPQFKLPEAEEGEEQVDYVCAVKENAPMENFQIGEVNFEKRVFPSRASDMNHREEYFAPLFLVRKMTEKQAKAIQERAQKTYMRIPSRRNPKFDPREKNSEEKENLPGFTTSLFEWMLFVKTSEFNPITMQNKPAEPITEEQVEKMQPTDLQQALIIENSRRSKK